MKKYFYFLLSSLILLSACGKKASNTSNTETTDSTKVAPIKIDSSLFEVDTFHVVQNETKCNEGECSSCDLYYEKIRTPLLPVHDSVNQYIDTMMNHALNEMSSEKLGLDLKKRADDFINTSNDPDFEAFSGWDYTIHSTILRPVTEIISVSSGWGGFMGGAHPNYYSETVNFFVSNGKKVQLGDLFKDIKQLNKIAEPYFRKQNELDATTSLEELGFWFKDNLFTVNENFDISDESIIWQYNSYEVGPYVIGQPSVKVPLKALEKIMKVKFTVMAIQ